MNVRSEDGDNDRFDCISLAQRSRLPFSIFLFTLIVAVITLPATTALPLGEYPRLSGRLPWAVSGRRWLFLLSKVSLVVPLVCLSFGGCCLWNSLPQFDKHAIYPARALVLRVSIRLSMDTPGSAKAVPGMPSGALQPGSGWRSFTKFSGLERYGADLRRWPWIAAYSGVADQLVQHAAMALPGCFVGRPVLGCLCAFCRPRLGNLQMYRAAVGFIDDCKTNVRISSVSSQFRKALCIRARLRSCREGAVSTRALEAA